MKSILHYASKATQILVTSLILICLVYVLQLMTLGAVRLCVTPKTQASKPYTPDPARRSFRFLLDGTVHQVKSSQEMDAQGKTQDIEEVYDVNNVLIERRPSQEKPNRIYLSYATRMDNLYGKDRLDSQYAIRSGFSITMDVPVMEDDTLQEIWRYDRRREVFAGYDRTGKVLGDLCKEGFTPDPATGTALGALQGYKWWQPEKNRTKLLWLTQRHLYEIDVNARKVDRLAQYDKIYIGSLSAQAWVETDKTAREYADPNVYRPLIVCQSSKDTYHLTLRDPNQSITVSMPEAWKEWGGSCRFSTTETDMFMVR
jgi:hypothetical protein